MGGGGGGVKLESKTTRASKGGGGGGKVLEFTPMTGLDTSGAQYIIIIIIMISRCVCVSPCMAE